MNQNALSREEEGELLCGLLEAPAPSGISFFVPERNPSYSDASTSSVPFCAIPQQFISLAPYDSPIADSDGDVSPLYFLRYTNYKMPITVGSSTRRSTRLVTPILTALHASDVPNVILLDKLKPGWTYYIRPAAYASCLVDASNLSVKPLGCLTLLVRTAKCSARVQFLVVSKIFVGWILHTSLINRYVRAIYLQRKLIYLTQVDTFPRVPAGTPVSIVGSDESGKNQ